ncbi:MAG: hypothetical protein PBV86_00040 [Delftia lacustris]|uniref:hypothetical protein n=1 Tax=Delftia TaxID=80865 RepID=UPI0012A7D315|nr:hypothetical protein GCS91_24215 [Delftia tsuruhatensis]
MGALQRDEEFSAAGQSGNSSQVKTRVINNRYKVNFAGKWWQSPGWYDQVDNASVTTYAYDAMNRQTVSREEQIQKQGLDPKATTIVTTLTHNYAYGLAVSGDGELQAGQTLSIPKLALNANNADTFQPYDPSRVTGSLDSVLPAPVLAALSAQPLRRAAPP